MKPARARSSRNLPLGGLRVLVGRARQQEDLGIESLERKLELLLAPHLDDAVEPEPHGLGVLTHEPVFVLTRIFNGNEPCMGACEGRRCREQVALLLEEAAGGTVAAVPLASYRPPIRPLPLSVLWPHDEPAEVREHWVSWFGIPTQFAPHWAGDPMVAPDDLAVRGVVGDK